MVTARTRLTFGKHKGMQLEQCPVDYLRWMARELRDTDLHDWAVEAEKLVKAKRPQERAGKLEDAADTFLREHGVDPKKL